MTGLRRLIGMPVVRDGEPLGFVERGVLTENGTRLQGLVVRRGLGMAKWAPRSHIEVIGDTCVVLRGELLHVPKTAEHAFSCCYDTAGNCLGVVTDALLRREDLKVIALELGVGPLFSLAAPKAYAMEFRVKPSSTRTPKTAREVVTTRAATWKEVLGKIGKEEKL